MRSPGLYVETIEIRRRVSMSHIIITCIINDNVIAIYKKKISRSAFAYSSVSSVRPITFELRFCFNNTDSRCVYLLIQSICSIFKILALADRQRLTLFFYYYYFRSCPAFPCHAIPADRFEC